MTEWLGANVALVWLAAALLLGIGELLAPGVFLVFLAAAAAITGAAAFALPALPVAAQFAVFAAWSVIAVLVGRRWYSDYPVETSDPMLNDRSARLRGETVTVVAPIVDGHGRVRIGDGEWPATGPDTATGTRVRIVSVDGAIVRVEALTGTP